MITSYEVGSVFRIIDEASPALERIAKLAADVDKQVEAAKKNLQSLGRTSLTGLATRAKAAADAIGRVGTVSEQTSGVFAASMGKMEADVMAATASVASLTAELKAAAWAARSIRVPNLAGHS